MRAVPAADKVRFQGQEIAFVVATGRYAARDALELISVDYEPLPPLAPRRWRPAAIADYDPVEGRLTRWKTRLSWR